MSHRKDLALAGLHYAPNFNPVATVDGECGMIVDADVLNEMREAETAGGPPPLEVGEPMKHL